MEIELLLLVITGVAQGIVVFPLVELSFRVVRSKDAQGLIWQVPLALIILSCAGAVLLWFPLTLFDSAIRQQKSIYWFASFFVGMGITATISRVISAKKNK